MLTKRQFLKGLAGSAALLVTAPLQWLLPKESIPLPVVYGDVHGASGVYTHNKMTFTNGNTVEVVLVDGNTVTIK